MTSETQYVLIATAAGAFVQLATLVITIAVRAKQTSMHVDMNGNLAKLLQKTAEAEYNRGKLEATVIAAAAASAVAAVKTHDPK